MTKCGHSFCHSCILRSLEQSPRCPKCNFHLDTTNNPNSPTLIPNFALEELVAKSKARREAGAAERATKNLPDDLQRALAARGPLMAGAAAARHSAAGVGLREIDDMINILVGKREEMEAESFLAQVKLANLLGQCV